MDWTKTDKTINQKYYYYCDILEQLGKIELYETPTLEDIQPSRGVIQAGYKEMKEVGFEGNLIYYLCFVSTIYLINIARKKNFNNIHVAKFIIENYYEYRENTVNLLRLFHMAPNIFMKFVINKEEYRNEKGTIVYNGKYRLDEYKIFMMMSSAWYVLRFGGIMCNQKPVERIYDTDDEEELKYYSLINQLVDG